MRLVRGQGGGDFYESFSDLIFGTLVIFLVVVMALVLKVRDAAETLDDLTGGIVTPHRYTGGSDEPIYHVVSLRFDDEHLIGFLPGHIESRWNESRGEGRNDPILEFAKAFLDHRMGLMSVDEFRSTAHDGISSRLASKSYVHDQPSDVVLRLLAYERHVGGSLHGKTAEEVRDAIGGIRLWEDNQSTTPSFPYTQLRRQFQDWRTYGGLGRWTARAFEEAINPHREQAHATPAVGADVIFTVGDERLIRVGDAVMPPSTFRAFLSSIVPGADFILEYRSPRGAIVQPPLWVEDEILLPLGYTGRIVRDEPLAIED